MLTLAACGGDAPGGQRLVGGTGFTFEAPKGWAIVRSARQVQAVEGGSSAALVSVTRFPLLRAFHPSLWPRVVHELDGAAAAIARQQHGAVTDDRDITVSNERARRYEVVYSRDGRKLVEELAFVLRGKTEYLLLCRYEHGKSRDACDKLMSSFRLA